MAAKGRVVPVDEMVDLSDNIAETFLVLSGKFDSRIAEFKAAKDASEQAAGVVETLSEAQKIRDEAAEYARKSNADSDAELAKAAGKRDEAESILADAKAVSQKASERERKVSSREQEVESVKQTHENHRKLLEQTALDLDAERERIASDRRQLEQDRLALSKAKEAFERWKEAVPS